MGSRRAEVEELPVAWIDGGRADRGAAAAESSRWHSSSRATTIWPDGDAGQRRSGRTRLRGGGGTQRRMGWRRRLPPYLPYGS
uniref:Uncharacterized protein n=1 Tax=Leersia perrieri TaxID=77586 RepID=A0A0D9VQ09_9ORYZ